MVFVEGIAVKKMYGQHFLRWQAVIDHMVANVILDENSSVFEIGCGDGFLTRSILQQPIKRLWVFEIDADWARFVEKKYADLRMTIFQENILDVDWARFDEHKPWTLLANLPYQITFPILHMLHKNRAVLKEGVIMIQEEVAEKILKTHGRGYGYPSLFFQHYFEWKKLDKVPPQAFEPPPKVDSRLLYFKPKQSVQPIKNEEEFWQFIKLCFKQPRRTLKNNLQQTHFDLTKISETTLALRAQQMSMNDLLSLWDKLNA
ncbi:MAG: Ribosomal RNA small subunit methyltransferase A [Candidatus Dependentiae bacterium ADurb.Bin331]|nr:MAG: Ribosomal RNA small subunit methyltransferase A [Candidatus Dependentiae bacterium ADurb.Bin331]